MLMFGIVSDVDAGKGLARVNFDADDLVSDWLPVMVRKSFNEKESFPLDISEHVAVLMDDGCETGVILGAIYSESEKPSFTSADVFGIKFKNGDEFSYDRSAKKETKKVGDSEVSISDQGLTLKKASESLKSIISDLIDGILAETHPTSSGPSGTPVNAITFSQIKTRVSNLFEA